MITLDKVWANQTVNFLREPGFSYCEYIGTDKHICTKSMYVYVCMNILMCEKTFLSVNTARIDN